MLLASPNDDEGDPPPPAKGEKLDPVFYTFVRPEGMSTRVRQRTTTDAPKQGDWIVIEDYTVPAIVPDDGQNITPARPLDREEGRVLSIDGETARIALGGNVGIGGEHSMGANIVEIPLKHVFVMVSSSLRVGDPVRVNRGKMLDTAGIIVWSERGKVCFRSDGIEYTLPIEHIDLIVPHERTRAP